MPIDIRTRHKAECGLKTVGKLSVRTVRGEIRTADRTLKTARREQNRQDEGSTGYAVNRVSDAERITAKKLDNRGRKAVRYSKRRIRRGVADRRDRARERAAEKEKEKEEAKEKEKSTARQGGQGSRETAPTDRSRETAPADRSRAQRGTADAARREAARQQAIRKAQEQEKRTVKGVFSKIGNIFKKVGKVGGKIISAFNFAIAGVWLLAMLILVIAVMGAAMMLFGNNSRVNSLESANPDALEVYMYLTENMGLNSAAACGVLANIEAESGFSIHAIGDEGTSYGLCQWHNSRWDRLEQVCEENGLSPDTREGQLYYLSWELENCYPDVMEYLRQVEDDAGGCYDAASYFCINFEHPADAEEKADKRGINASEKYWMLYGNLYLDNPGGAGSALAQVAYSQLGNEGGEKYWSWYGFPKRVEWCAIFVSWCADQCGYLGSGVMPRNADIGNVDTGYEWYYRNARMVVAQPDVEPEPGWVAFFGRGHTGIVYECKDGVVYLVEGNSMDAVCLNSYRLENIRDDIWGYGVPNFPEY